jgi:upstream activation factor subunit UAF30
VQPWYSQEADVKPTVTSPKPKLPNFSKVKRARSPSSTVDSSDAVPASSPAFALASTSATRVKKEEAPALTDEELARQMQAEFEQQATVGRSTRNGGSAASAVKKRAPIKKSKKNKKAGSDDDDDGAVKKKKRKTSHTGFNKLHVLSDEMAEVCGAPVLSRPGVTKVSPLSSAQDPPRTVNLISSSTASQALWKYIKANDLQDPDLRTDILPDDQLKVRTVPEV